MMLLIFVLVLVSCQKPGDKLVIGIIKPSIDHLPLSYGIANGTIDRARYELISFSSGWELQEAIIAGRTDIAIMPFTYAWNAASKGYPIRTVSFFERETDGIVTSAAITKTSDLDGRKIGILRASTLDILMQDFARMNNIDYEAISFRTPNEMIAALTSGVVDAIVVYVPLIQKLDDKYHVIHWFGSSYPAHPCCDISVNTRQLTASKTVLLQGLISKLDEIILKVNALDSNVMDFVCKSYGLTLDQAYAALEHTVFATGLDENSKAFQRDMIEHAIRSGYQSHSLTDEQIYLDIYK